MKIIKQIIIVAFLFLLFYGCRKDWKEHYSTNIQTVNKNVWEDVQKDPNLSEFVKYIKKYQLDTIFAKTDKVYTMFIPSDEAFANYSENSDSTLLLLKYLISQYYIESTSIQGKRKLLSLGKKYPTFWNNAGKSFFDGIYLKFESPLYLNGKFYIMDTIAYPKLNLYEYYSQFNPVFKNYKDSKDSLTVDKTKSTPIGYDAKGNVIYDTVPLIRNSFEEKFFPVSKESRYKTATVVFPLSTDYNVALTAMAQKLKTQGAPYNDYNDVPIRWQYDILVPYLMKYGIFENELEPADFTKYTKKDTIKLKNILGDSIVIKYKVFNKNVCSNGYAYDYYNFAIPDTVWNGIYRFEAERLVKTTGVNTFAWYPSLVTESYTQQLTILKEYTPVKTSNDTSVRVVFPNSYSGEYSIQFNVANLLPRKYLMVIRTNYSYGGVYDIYVNDTKVIADFDYQTKNTLFPSQIRFKSAVTGKFYTTTWSNPWVSFDCFITPTDYGTCRIKIVNKKACANTTLINRGLSIDYIDFKPYW